MLLVLVITMALMIMSPSMEMARVQEFLLLLVVVRVISATVTSGGTDTTFGKISLDNITGIGTAPTLKLDVIIPPPNGHGFDPVTEMGAYRAMINAKLSYDEGAGDFPIDNDYRRIGLITNPLKFGTSGVNLRSCCFCNS